MTDPLRAVDPCPLCGASGAWLYRGRDLLLDQETHTHHDYARCGTCLADYQTPMPEPAALGAFYPREYLGHAEPQKPRRLSRAHRVVLAGSYEYRSLSPEPWKRWLGSILGLIRYRDEIHAAGLGRLLDVGCGNGRFLLKMAELGWEVTGVDTSEAAVSACRAAGLEAREGELQDLGMAAQSFDLISARHVIEHVPSPNAFVAEIARLLRPGGRLVIRTPNAAALGRRWFGAHWYANDIPRHLILYRRRNLDALAREHGLKSLSHRSFTTPKIILNSWDYARGRREESKRLRLPRMIARAYVGLAAVAGAGDELFAVYTKSV